MKVSDFDHELSASVNEPRNELVIPSVHHEMSVIINGEERRVADPFTPFRIWT